MTKELKELASEIEALFAKVAGFVADEGQEALTGLREKLHLLAGTAPLEGADTEETVAAAPADAEKAPAEEVAAATA